MKLFFFYALLLPAVLQAQEVSDEKKQEAPDNNYSRLIFEAELLPTPTDSGSANAALPKANNASVEYAAAPAVTAADGSANFAAGAAGSGDSVASTSPQVDTAAIGRYENSISAVAESEGLYADSLREQYESLGELYQQNNEHEKAIAAFENAMHIDRVNDGLFTVRQLPLVENIIESYTALNDIAEVDDREGYLFYVSQKAYAADDPRLLAAKEHWADWNVKSYLLEGITDSGRFDPMGLSRSDTTIDGGYVAIQNPNNGTFVYVPRRNIRDVLSKPGDDLYPSFGPTGIGSNELYQRSATYAVTPEDIIDRRLRTARKLYEEISSTSNEAFLSEHGRPVQQKLANVAFAAKQQIQALENTASDGSLLFNHPFPDPTSNPVIARGYTKNREALEAIAQKLDADASSDPVEVARAYIDAGDWHLGFDRPQTGRTSYEKALAVLAEAGMTSADISMVFNSTPLIPVPGFALHPYSRAYYGIPADAELAYAGFIDLRLTINQNGNIRSSDIIAVSEGTSQRIRNVLLDFLRNNRMRPLVQDGKLVKESELNLRIHYSF